MEKKKKKQIPGFIDLLNQNLQGVGSQDSAFLPTLWIFFYFERYPTCKEIEREVPFEYPSPRFTDC